MASFREAVGDAVRAGVCNLIAEDPNVVSLLESLGLDDTALSAAGRAFRLSYCSNNEPVGEDPGFTGGQCPGVQYRVRLRMVRDDGSLVVDRDHETTLPGPIGKAFVIFPVNDVQSGARIPYGDGQVANFYNSSAGPHPHKVDIQQVFRVDGQPDNCGDPGLTIPPGTNGPIETTTNITFEDNNNSTTNIGGTLRIFAPVFAPTFAPSIPFNLDLGGLTLEGEFNLDGEVNIDLGFGDGPGTDLPGSDPPTEPPAPQADVIIGARVRIVSDNGSTSTVLFNGENPDLYLPRAGTIQFLQPAGDGQAWSGDIPIKTSPQWIPCGPPGYASRIAFTPTLGIELAVTPVLGKPPRP